MTCSRGTAFLACTLAFVQTANPAVSSKVSSPIELARRAEHLKPGEWVWAPQISPAGPVLIYVDLSRQLATIYRNGIRIGVSTISSGMQGHATPTGVFTILQKHADHKSNIYNNAPMPFMQRLTWGGVALHAGNLPGYPQSHGCIRLPYTFSQELYKVTSLGGTIAVEGNAAKKIESTRGTLVSPMDTKGQQVTSQALNNAEYRWQPELSPTGPLSIVISKSDHQMLVMRNGIEIGRSAIEIDPIDENPRVLTLVQQSNGNPRWIFVGLPGSEDGHGVEVDNDTLNRVRMPRTFYDSLKAQLKSGTTVMVTMAHISPDTTGEKLTIMDAVSPGS
jgi:hypothetical protein